MIATGRILARIILALPFLTGGISILSGCERRAPAPAPSVEEVAGLSEKGFAKPTGPWGEGSQVALAEEVRKAHQLADHAQTAEAKEEALASLERVTGKLSQVGTPHTIAVRQDLAARIAQLMSELGRAEDARTQLRGALALSEKPTILRAHLFMTLSDVEEADKRNDAATSALMEALKINQHLLDTELENP